MTLLLLALGCATKYDSTVYGGGTIRIVVEPVGEAGIALDETFPGATSAMLRAIADETSASADMGHGTLHEVTERGSDYTDRYLTVYGPASVSAGDCFMDSVTVIADNTGLDILIDDDEGGHTTFLQGFDLDGPPGPTGSAQAQIPLRVQNFGGFDDVAPCWGSDPREHTVTVEWAFDESAEWVHRVPWDPDPSIY